MVAALVSGLTFAGEVFVYARGDLDRIGGAALLGVIAATAAGALYAARMDDGRRRTALLVGTAATMWAFGLIGVFSPMFLLLLAALPATAAAMRAGRASAGLRGAFLATCLILVVAAALTATTVVLAG